MYFVQLCFATGQAFLCNHKLSTDRFLTWKQVGWWNLQAEQCSHQNVCGASQTIAPKCLQVRHIMLIVFPVDNMEACILTFIDGSVHFWHFWQKTQNSLEFYVYKPQHVIPHIIIQTFVYKMFTPSSTWTLQTKFIWLDSLVPMCFPCHCHRCQTNEVSQFLWWKLFLKHDMSRPESGLE